MSEVRIFLGAPSAMSMDETWMQAALDLAERAAARGEVPVGCVIVRDGAIVGAGYNRREGDRDPTAHAEMIAIRAAAVSLGDHRLGGCTAYVTLEPCPMCAGALVHARVDRVVYGAADPKAGAVETLYAIGRDTRLNHVFEARGGVLADESARKLRTFFEALRAQGKK